MLKRALRHPRVLAFGAAWLGCYLRFALRTTRWRVEGQAVGFINTTPAIYAFWHERLPMMPALWMHARDVRRVAGQPRGRMHVLVSRHQDGRMIGDMMRGFDLDLIYGSSAKPGQKGGGQQKGGASGLRALLAVLAAGDQVVITPDGPRGPWRVPAPGVAQLAALAQAPIVPCAAQTTRSRVLPSWDRMIVPLPFGRGVLVCGDPILVPRAGWADGMPGIAAALTAVADQADRSCRV